MGALASTVAAANKVPIALGTGKIAIGWIDTAGLLSDIQDADFRVVDVADGSKRFAVEVPAGMTSGKTLTLDLGNQTDNWSITVPVLAGNDTLVTLATAQTLTGVKTFSDVVKTSIGFWSLENGSDTFIAGSHVFLTDGTVTNGYAIQQSASNHLDFWSYAATVPTRRARLTDAGVLSLLATTGTTLTVSSTQDSTTKDTGSIVTEGGLGVEKALYVGATANVGADLTVASSVKVGDISGYGIVSLNNDISSVASAVGMYGGGGGDDNLYLNAPTGFSVQVRVNNTQVLSAIAGNVTINPTTGTTLTVSSTDVIAASVAGGIQSGNASAAAGEIRRIGATATRQQFYLEADGFASVILSMNNAGVTDQGIPTGAGGVGSANGIDFHLVTSATSRLKVASGGDISLSNTTASTSTTTGSLVNAGGFGNAGAAHIGGGIVASGTAQSEFQGGVKITGFSSAWSGAGPEIGFDGTSGFITCYNRGIAQYLGFVFSAKSHAWDCSGTAALTIDLNRNIVCGSAALATNATDGHLYIPTCAGTPTGVPTAFTGRTALIVDSTNNKLYFYSGGAWRDAGP